MWAAMALKNDCMFELHQYDEMKNHATLTIETRTIRSEFFVVVSAYDFSFAYEVYEIFVLTTGKVCVGKRCACAICERSEVHDEGILAHRGEDEDIINGCTDRKKMSYCFTIAMSRRVCERQE